MQYCPKCGNTGIDAYGNPCTCKFNEQKFYGTVSCMEIPDQYRGLLFSTALIPSDIDKSYGEFLQRLYTDITSLNLKNHNYCICSPIGHSKTVFAYSCIDALFRKNIPTFPIYDILEIKRILLDMDMCRKSIYEVTDPERIFSVPYLFAKIPRVNVYEVFSTIAFILDRRVRRNGSTILLFDGTWNLLVSTDKNDIMSGLLGNGTYSTLEQKTWFTKTTQAPDIIIPENRG